MQVIAGSNAPVGHLVFSDGLATVSVFIEPSHATEPGDARPCQGGCGVCLLAQAQRAPGYRRRRSSCGYRRGDRGGRHRGRAIAPAHPSSRRNRRSAALIPTLASVARHAAMDRLLLAPTAPCVRSSWQILPSCSIQTRPPQVRVIDIGEDPALERKYGERIPVLTADGEFVCAYRLDRRRGREALLLGPRDRLNLESECRNRVLRAGAEESFRYNPPPPASQPPPDEADPQFFHHRARRPRQIHARRPLHPALRRSGRPRDGESGARFHGSRTRARHHDQGAERLAALPTRRTARPISSI